MREKVTVSALQTDWHSINWSYASRSVRMLRQAIFQAGNAGDLKRTRTLQRIMLRSPENRVLSIRRITEINAGKRTPGTDDLLIGSPEEKTALMTELMDIRAWEPLPARRLHIPKDKGKTRPLSIPAIRDRIVQMMVKNALEPYWEAQFEDSSYGFRPGRSCHDAIGRLRILTQAGRKREWVLDADIEGAFDHIDHEKLMELLGNFPARDLIRRWLKAGYLEGDIFRETEAGAAQGSVISPLLANIALHGMEQALGVRYGKLRGYDVLEPDCPALVRYADDFVVLCRTRKETERAKRALDVFLAERGLSMAEEKTRIVHLNEGFDFLGFNVRRYRVRNARRGVRLLMKPSKQSVKAIRRTLKQTFRSCHGYKVEALNHKTNPIIRGWAQYFRIGVSGRAFKDLDHYLYRLQKCWVKRQHPHKTWKWMREEYWGMYHGNDVWVFGKKDEELMLKFSWFPIRRHLPVRRFACRDDPALEGYWEQRKSNVTRSPRPASA